MNELILVLSFGHIGRRFLLAHKLPAIVYHQFIQKNKLKFKDTLLKEYLNIISFTSLRC